MNTTLYNLEKSVEKSTGKSVAYLRSTPLCELRKEAEQRTGTSTEISGVDTSTLYVLGMPVRVIIDNYKL